MPGVFARLGDKGLGGGKRVLEIGVDRFEQEKIGADAVAAARALVSRRLPGRTQPAGNDIARNGDIAPMHQGINVAIPGNVVPGWLRPAWQPAGDQGPCGGDRVGTDLFLLEPVNTNLKNTLPA